MNTRYRTSLYAAPIIGETIPTRYEVRQEVWKVIEKKSKQNALDIVVDKQMISNEGTEISFTVMDVPFEMAYLLCFQPEGRGVLGKKASQNSVQNVLNFCDILGSEIGTSKLDLKFRRVHLLNQDRIDISDWRVTCPYTKPPSETSLMEFVSHSVYENVFQSIPKTTQFYVFSKTHDRRSSPFMKLRENIGAYGKVIGPEPLSTSEEFYESLARRDKENGMFVFLEDTDGLKSHYSEYKIFYDSNHMPTQFVSANTVESKLGYFRGVDANLILEMTTKMGKQPVILKTPEGIITNDGFLCLSDIVNVSQRLFGAIFTYSKQGLEQMREDVQIYNDIKFRTPTPYSIDIDEENTTLLANKIKKLIGRRMKIDILLTRRWAETNLQKLIDLLFDNKIEVQKAYYISSKTSRFVDDYLEDSANYRSLKHPYLIIGKKIGFLKTCTEIRIYPNLFSLFIELVWPPEAELTQNDFEKTLWLVKKRLYRIQEFYILKNLEPLYVFRNLKKMYIADIATKLSIPLRLLI